MDLGKMIEAIEVSPEKPIRAAKFAYFRSDGMFDSLDWLPAYRAEDVAVHGVDQCDGERTPDPTGRCQLCGFHAIPRPEARRLRTEKIGSVLLDVELSGIVVVHENGWRAERLRVVMGWLGRCDICKQDWEDRLVQSWYAAAGMPPRFWPMCTSCAKPFHPQPQLSLEEAAEKWGVEIGLWTE